MLDARTDDALVDSRSGIFKLVGEYTSTLKRKLEELSNRVADLDEQWCSKSKRIKDWSMDRAFREGKSFFAQQVERVDDLSKEVEEILGHCSFQKGLTTHAVRCRKSSPLVTTKLVGAKGERTVKGICDYLMEEESNIIGIYGMGGVGKTAILMHVHNRVLENPAFNDVFWVTIPQEFSICELQDEIANAIRLDNLSKDRDIRRRASILNRHLKKKRSILILDDLWMHFNFEDVGIPVEKGGIKLILITRSLDVCDKMLCQKQIKIEPLYRSGAWDLFLNKLCFGRVLPSEVKKIASSIVDKFWGLPLGIIEIATHMRGVKEVHEWKDLLQKLENSMMELNVFKKLKLSYMNLGNIQVQHCFLHLIFCFERDYFEYGFSKKVLIESFIDEGLLSGIATRQELHNQGKIILDKIKKACLGVDIDEGVSVHPLIRDMALQIVTTTTHMVKANMELKEIPKDKFWTDHLEKVFLQSNNIKEIPYGISPNCPKLTRLSLNNNVSLEAIHESFFKHMKGLKVLDLSKTKITELPDTISHLESLEALLLQECEGLRYIPRVRKLGSLKKLDLFGCAMLEEVPEVMEMLVKLTYLDLLGTNIKALPEGVLGKLVNLQYPVINCIMEREEEIELTGVEGLYGSIPDVETFNEYMSFLEQNSSQPYDLALSASRNYFHWDMQERRIIIESCHSIAARVDGEIGGDGHALLPKNVQVLEVRWCDEVTRLCEVGPFDNLEELVIEKWEKLEELGAVRFPLLRRLNITGCSKLKHLLQVGEGLPRLQWFKIEGSEELEGINIVAPFLYGIEVYGCPNMKRVVEFEWLDTRLPNLRSIKIKNCEKLEEIIGGLVMLIGKTYCLTKIEIQGCNNLKMVLLMQHMSLHLPFLREISVQDCKGIEVIIGTIPNMTQPYFLHLTHLTLSNLPELKSICDGTMNCLSIESINIKFCPKLNGLPYPPPFRRPIWIDCLTWQSLERDHSPFPPSLEHLARFLARGEGVSDQRIVKYIKSCDSLVARVDGEIGGDGCNLLLKNVQVLIVGRGSGVTSLSKVGPLKNLEDLTIQGWEKLEELGAIHFPHLQKLNITQCSKLKHLSVEGQGLPRLEWFKIEGSKELEGIDLAAPNLNYMEVSECPKMKRVVEWNWLAIDLPKLKFIGIFNCEKLEQIIGGAPLPSGATCLLTYLEINQCNNIKGVLLTYDMLLCLPFLRQITVENYTGIEVIIGNASMMRPDYSGNLTHLTLCSLPELKSICDCMRTGICCNIQFIEISDCPKLKRIPLPLHSRQLYNGLPSPPPSLVQILIDRQTCQIVESNS
ncbi:hypothetical protein EUGRSUZ_F00837 [Eucalyptus grandis]|uniref:Uncharacterized protein n=2 Tax=Eucalyptus grandis TaxID=71139 RepID=A0A059BLU2_EUCGR|nr:hypothetical protein EUGRSUZ_F00837 [Eucalyptus grandis]